MLQPSQSAPRKFGIELVGAIPWGTHLCQFYDTKQDLIDILVPYFAEGLRSNEFCMWVTSPPLDVAEAKEALRRAVPDLDRCLQKGQIEVVSFNDWYLKEGRFDCDRVLRGWEEGEASALENGFEGLRLTGNTFWVERKLWNSFVDYEAMINAVIGKHRIIALCTYCLPKCSGTDVMDVVRNHVGTLIKQGEKWVMVEDASQRKREERKLAESERRWATTLSSIGDAVIATDLEGRITFMNAVAEELTGWSLQESLQRPVAEVFEIVDEKTRRKVEDPVAKVLKKGSIVGLANHTVLVRRDGRQIIIDDSGAPIKDENGEITGVVVVFRDITARKKAERALLKSETLRSASLYARNLIEASLDPLVTINSEGKITDVNKATELVTGLPREKLIGSDFCDYFTEPEKAREGYKQVFTKGLVRDYPLAIRHKGGRITDVLYNATVYRNEKDEIQGVFAAARDVTERKLAEERIREQAELLNQAHDAITVRDLNNNITYWNSGAERLYGWKAEEVMNKNMRELLYNDSPQFSEALAILMEKGEWSGELKHKTKDGREVIVDSHWTLVSDANKKPKLIMDINTDITEKKNLQAQFLRAQRLESLGTLAGGIAHDINNILTPIMLTLSLLDQNLTKEEDHKMISMLLKEAKRGADLTKQMLTFARGVEGVRLPIQVPTLVNEVVKTIEETFPRSIMIHTEIDPDTRAVLGDSTQLHQVLINMCLNARDAMPSGGSLTITAENVFIDECYARTHIEAKAGPYVSIAVTDTGFGIPPEVKERLFEPFFTTKKLGEGTGLGLSTSRSIVKSHGGFINVYSEPGKGATFKIYLPPADSQRKESEDRSPDFPKGSGQTILVVDDEELIRITATMALENNGYRTLSANDGAEAVAVYTSNRNKIAAVLLDVAMPIMGGEATIRALKKIDPGIRIIVMSGLADNGKYKPMMNQANAFITKPFTADKLLKVVGGILSNRPL